jgi:hypothetical protein
MSSRTSRLAAPVAAVLALAAAAAAPGAVPNRAKALALQKSDFPRGVVAKDASGEATAAGSGYGVTYHYTSGGRPYELSVAVTVFKSRAVAVQFFRELKGDLIPAAPKLKLPAPLYGDEQIATHSVLGGSQLIVRKGTVVWYLEPQTYMVRGGKQYELTRAQTVALYRLYGRKQQRKVGKG